MCRRIMLKKGNAVVIIMWFQLKGITHSQDMDINWELCHYIYIYIYVLLWNIVQFMTIVSHNYQTYTLYSTTTDIIFHQIDLILLRGKSSGVMAWVPSNDAEKWRDFSADSCWFEISFLALHGFTALISYGSRSEKKVYMICDMCI